MIVVSDTSPISNLLLINRIELLPALYERVIIPRSVLDELRAVDAQRVALDNFDWIDVIDLKDTSLYFDLLSDLDRGEAEAISLSLEINADLLLIDELLGRNAARKLGLEIVGLLGVLVEAKRNGLITAVKPEIDKLKVGGRFWISTELVEEVLESVGEK